MNNSLQGCVEAGFFTYECATLVYESPTTVVLNGGVLILGGDPQLLEDIQNSTTTSPFDPGTSTLGHYPNPFLWQAVDGFKAQGYTITDILVGGEGSQGNPNEFFVVMSK
jgi:hypothetical protein